MTFSSTLLSLVLVLASSSAWGMARAHGSGVKQIGMYMHQNTGSPNGTVSDVLPPLKGGNTTFGIVRMFDNELRDGPHRSNSMLLGRMEGFVAFTGVGSMEGKLSVVTFVFTSGEYSGSTLVVAGIVQSIEGAIERPVVGGTDKFRFARGYSVATTVSKPTPVITVFKVNLFVKLDV